MGNATGRWIAALAVLACACLWLDFRHIAESLPYPQHIDEPALANPAIRMLTTGTLHPYEFNYPSLAKYMTALAMAAGFLRAAGELQLHEVARIGCVQFPYYNVPEVMQAARQLFALSAVTTLLATGAAAFYAFQRPATILLAPLALALSPMFLTDSWSYLNVDIVGTCFVALTIACCLAGTRRPSMVRCAVLPGICVGLAGGSKYTLAVVILPVLVAIALFMPKGRRVVASVTALAVAGAAFLVAMPYALLDIPGTLNGLAFDAFHYASGHEGVNVERGLPQMLAYTRDFAHELGLVGLIVAEIGACAFLTSDVRRLLVLAAFPLALLRMLVSSRVHFERNALPVVGVGGIFLAYGLVRAHEWLSAFALARGWSARRVTPALALALGVAVFPLWRLRDWVRDRTDSRTLAQRWIEQHVPGGSAVLVPDELHLKPDTLGRRAQSIELASAQDPKDLQELLEGVRRPALILLPVWGADPRFPGQDRADALNRAGTGLTVLRSFGTNPLLVNYPETAPEGDPAFVIARVGKAVRH